MRKTSAITASFLVLSSPLGAQHPAENFWIIGGISQGDSLAEVEEVAERLGWTLKSGVPVEGSWSLSTPESEYWLAFCDGGLTYASWTVNENTPFLRSLDQNVNRLGFRLSNWGVSSVYYDSEQRDRNTMEMRFEHPDKRYSIIYHLYDNNAQVTLEDSRHDDSFGCEGDGSED